VPAAPLSLADAVSRLGIRSVELAQAIREGKVVTVRGRRGELLVADEEVERVRREGVEVERLATVAPGKRGAPLPGPEHWR